MPLIDATINVVNNYDRVAEQLANAKAAYKDACRERSAVTKQISKHLKRAIDSVPGSGHLRLSVCRDNPYYEHVCKTVKTAIAYVSLSRYPYEWDESHAPAAYTATELAVLAAVTSAIADVGFDNEMVVREGNLTTWILAIPVDLSPVFK